ncbi:MAG: TetR family transcriptional regulator [Hyphomonadaceae bacterium]
MSSDSTRDRILDATVDLLRRHGPGKTGVVDVARALDMSHSNVYRHFASKAELFDAVAERWLETVSAPLWKIAKSDAPAPERLKKWAKALAQIKRKKVLDDPELFAVYGQITANAREVVAHHLADLRDQVAQILRDGTKAKAWRVKDAEATAALLLHATARFHHPYHVHADGGKSDLSELDKLMDILIAGLAA